MWVEIGLKRGDLSQNVKNELELSGQNGSVE